MFIGHLGVALAAKRIAPRTSLGLLVFAAEFLDLLWPIFLLLGIEHVRIVPGITRVSPFDFYDYPISHSLLMVVVWSLSVAAAYYLASRYTRGAWVSGFLVLSHWLLDALVHRPDLPVRSGGTTFVGFGLWNSWPGSIAAELAIFLPGVILYVRSTHARDRIGRYAFWSLIIFLLVGWISSLLAGAPPSVTSVAWGGVSMWLLVPWAWWADKSRKLTQSVFL
jgi:hypothetical protein